MREIAFCATVAAASTAFAACETTAELVGSKEDLLAAAGFTVQPANTPQRETELKQLPPNKFVFKTKGDRVSYVYADPVVCNCLYPMVHSSDDVLARANALSKAFRAKGLPVILVNVAGGAPVRTEQARPAGGFPEGWANLAAGLTVEGGDVRITKRTWGAFTATDLETVHREQGVTQIILAGIATSIGVESTARQASELGFNVVLATDAMTDLNSDAHARSITHIFPRLGETDTTDAIIERLNASRS